MVGARLVMLREGRIVLEGDARSIPASTLEQAYFGFDAAEAQA